jgi:pyrophosphatase PpaX
MIKDVAVKQTERKGRGVFALRNFRRGELIFRGKKGRIVHKKDLPKLSPDDGMHLNEMGYDTYEIMRSPERFINHSCDPNSISKGRSVIAIKPIRKGQEITGDYRINAFDGNRWRCHCGSRNCKGWCTSDFFTIPKNLQKRYLPYTIEGIREEYERRHSAKAIFFDIDGTIIPLDVVAECFQDCCRHFHLRVPTKKEIMEKAIGYKISEYFPKLLCCVSYRKFKDYFERMQIENFKKYANILPYVKQTFKLVSGEDMKIGVVTTKVRREASAVLRGYGLHYDTLVAGDDLRKRKPDPEPVLRACRNLKVKPKDCIFVGDHPFDMMAAKSAGCTPVGVLTGWGNKNNLKKAGAKYLIKNMKGLWKIIGD